MTRQSDNTGQTPGKMTESDKPTGVRLVPQPHGGAIRTGGNPGNAGGLGRPREHIRATLRQHLDETMLTAVLEEWRAGKTTALQVAEFLGRYGLGTQTETVTPEDVAQTAQRMLAVLVDELVSRGWPLPDVQALATKMANAAKGEDA